MKIQTTTKLSQSLNYNVYQAINLLTYTNNLLEDFVNKQVESNPLINKKDRFFEQIDIIYKEKSVYEELFTQSRISFKNQKDLKIAYFLIENLDEFGFLKDIPENKFNDDDIFRVLKVLKEFEPVGVFSGSFGEYLEIFLSDKGISIDSSFIKNIQQISKFNIKTFANHFNYSLKDLKNWFNIIKKIPKYPFVKESNIERNVYDFFLTKENNEYNVKFCENFSLNLDLTLFKSIKSPNDLFYLRSQKKQALWLLSSLSRRKETLLKVANKIVEKQKNFFLNGKLNELGVKDLAKELNLNESTISRSIKDKTILTENGVFLLKDFLTHTVNYSTYGFNDEKTTSKEIVVSLKKIIETESKMSPLSDDSIVSKLKDSGIIIARRTVAKYRDKLSIPKAFDRRKAYEINYL